MRKDDADWPPDRPWRGGMAAMVLPRLRIYRVQRDNTPTRSTGLKMTGADSEQRYRMLFEHDLAGVYRTRLDGTILECNPSFAEMLGYESRNELLAANAADLYFSNTDRREFITRLRKSGRITNSELCLRRKDGTPIYIVENVNLVRDEDGKPTIIQGTMVDITQRKRAEEALLQSEQRHRELAGELRRLAQHLQRIREEERARIARELHDELGQDLTALSLDLHWLRTQASRDTAAARTRLESMAGVLGKTIPAIRRICSDLRPAILDNLGLVAAIEWQTRDFGARTGIRCVMSLPKLASQPSKDQAVSIFRILQESLTNVARHSKATEVAVALEAPDHTFVLEVRDNGIGLPARRLNGTGGLGLTGMRERALRWGGDVRITSAPDFGTTVSMRMPLAPLDSEGLP